LKPEWEQLRAAASALEGCDGSDEDVLTYAQFPQVSAKFFKTRHEGPKSLAKDPEPEPAEAPAAGKSGEAAKPGADQGTRTYVVTLHGKEHQVKVSAAG